MKIHSLDILVRKQQPKEVGSPLVLKVLGKFSFYELFLLYQITKSQLSKR